MSISISFFSNFLNAHQLPVALELSGDSDIDYSFIALKHIDGAAGRSCLNDDYPFVVRPYLNDTDAAIAMEHALKDDIAVFGDMAGDESYVRARAKTGKPFFRYAERILKRGDWWRFAPPKIARTHSRFTRYRRSNMFMLCTGAYACRDLCLSGFPEDKCFKWGYFPVFDEKDSRPALTSESEHPILFSAQRLISWKHVDLQIELARKLKDAGVSFALKIAGDGPMRSDIERAIRDFGLTDEVELLGMLTPERVSEFMCSSAVFIATSDRNEGWGATINEAMACGCCVVASDAMGSVPWLVDDRKTGLCFTSGSSDSLFQSVTAALGDDGLRARCGESAKQIVTEGLWSSRTAAERLVDFSRKWLDSGDADLITPYSSGPLSRCSSDTSLHF